MGFLLGKLRGVISTNPRASELIAMIISAVEKNFGYFLYDYAIRGPAAYLDLVTFFPLSAMSIVVAIPLLFSLRKALRTEYIL